MIVIVIINLRLQFSPEVLIDGRDTIQYEVLKELRGLKIALDQNADAAMQNIYPEGYVFLNAVYGLAWSSFLRQRGHENYFHEGHAEIQKTWMKLNSAEGRAPFSETLSLPYGAFYNGWSSYLLGLKLQLESEGVRNQEEVRHFQKQCESISEAIEVNPYPPSYEGAAWPADVMVCLASLALHDRLFEPRYEEAIARWLLEVRKQLDVRGMIPHSVDSESGEPDEKARGSSMALMVLFLHDIDYRFASEQFHLFKKNFVDTTFGLTAVREYPKGDSGTGDVDSGPVIMGFGGAATIVGMRALSVFGEGDLSLRIRNVIEAMAFPVEQTDYKEYFFGMLPIADAFIAWGHSSMRMTDEDVPFVQFRLYSLLGFILLSAFFWIVVRTKGQAPNHARRYCNAGE